MTDEFVNPQGAKEPEGSPKVSASPSRRTSAADPAVGRKRRRWMRRINTLLGLALMAWGLWYVTRQITLSEIARTLQMAKVGYIVLALVVILVTLVVKAWRWRLLFHPPEQRPPLPAAFWAMMLGQLVNTAVTFLRLGDIARVYGLSSQTGLSKMRALGTLIVEKSLDLVMLVITLLLLLPFVVLPDFVAERGFTIGGAALIAFIILYLVAYQIQWVTRILRRLLSFLPVPLSNRLMHWSVSGLEGLATLRDKRAVLELLGVSGLIGILHIMTPWVLFSAFGLPYGLIEATSIHIITSLASAVPIPTPAKLGIFEAAVMFMLSQYNLDNEALAFSYAIIFHLVIILPQIVLGTLSISRTNWHWRNPILSSETTPQQTPHSP